MHRHLKTSETAIEVLEPSAIFEAKDGRTESDTIDRPQWYCLVCAGEPHTQESVGKAVKLGAASALVIVGE